MADNIKNLHPNTIAFHCLEPEVATLIADIITAIYSVLNWRYSSKMLLMEILARLGEGKQFECSHLSFSEILFPSLDESVRKVKISRWIKKLIEDIEASLFIAVRIQSKRHDKSENGKYYGLPTLYQRGDFWGLFRAVQDAALECNLLNLPLKNRRQKVRAIVAQWLEKYGAKRIIRERKEKGEREREAGKSEAKACKCECEGCADCANRPRKNVDQLRRLPNDGYPALLENFSEGHYQHLCEYGEINSEFRFAVKRAFHALEVAELRAREMIVRNNKAGLRLIGGQPK